MGDLISMLRPGIHDPSVRPISDIIDFLFGFDQYVVYQYEHEVGMERGFARVMTT